MGFWKWVCGFFAKKEQKSAEPKAKIVSFFDLPEKVKTKIALFLPLPSIHALVKVNKITAQITKDPLFWQGLISEYFPRLSQIKAQEFQANPAFLFHDVFNNLVLRSYPQTNRALIASALKGDVIEKEEDAKKKQKLYLLAVCSGFLQFFDKLEAESLPNALFLAIKLGNYPVAINLWKKIPSAQKRDCIEPALYSAACSGNLEIMQFFIHENREGLYAGGLATPLVRAAEYNHTHIVKYMLPILNQGELNALKKDLGYLVRLMYAYDNPELVSLFKHLKQSNKSIREVIFSFGKKAISLIPKVLADEQIFHLQKKATVFSSHLNANECLLEDEQKWRRGFPQALILKATAYPVREAIASIITFVSGRFLEGDIARYFHAHIRPVSTISGMCESIDEISKIGPIKFLQINAHGSPELIILGGDEPGQFIDVSSFLNTTNTFKQDLSCLNKLAKGASIVLASCSVGGENVISFNKTFAMNMQNLFALHAPGSRVYAPNFLFFSNSLKIQFSPQMQVHGQGLSKFSILSLARAVIELLFISYFFPLRSFYSAYAPGYFLRELPVLEPDNPTLCREVLTYFSMKNYCDAEGVQPSFKSIERCVNNPGCYETVLHLKMIQPNDMSRLHVDRFSFSMLFHYGKKRFLEEFINKKTKAPQALTTVEEEVKVNSNPVYQGINSTWIAAAISIANQHCKFKSSSNFRTLMLTHAVQWACYVAISEKNAPSISTLTLNSSTNLLVDHFFKMNKTFRYISFASYFGWYLYQCYRHPEQMLSTLTECGTTMASSFVGNKIGEYAYRNFIAKHLPKFHAKTPQIEDKSEAKLTEDKPEKLKREKRPSFPITIM